MTKPALVVISLLLLLSPALSGCSDDWKKINGYAVNFRSTYHEVRYVELLAPTRNNEVIPNEIELGGDPRGRVTGALYGCVEDCPYSPTPFFRADMRDAPKNDGGTLIVSKNWTALEYGETYTLLLDEAGALNLYHCDPCKGDEPALPASPP